MLFYEGLSCPVCKIRFTDQDDVVVCPKCGLPHHRACWLIDKQCYMEDKHGTPEQWSREAAEAEATKGHTPPEGEPTNTQICSRCFTRNPEYAEICTHCGNVLRSSEWSSAERPEAREETYTPFKAAQVTEENRYRSDEHLNDATEAELAAVVGNNTQYYMPRFRKIAENQSGGWHWAGFLLGPLWLLYRKQYLLGIFMYLMQTILSFVTAVLYQPVNMAQDQQSMMQAMLEVAENPLFIPAWILSAVLFVGRLLLGLRGSELYYHHCQKKILAVKAKTPDISPAEMASVGGTSAGIAIVAYFIVTVVSNGLVTIFIA